VQLLAAWRKAGFHGPSHVEAAEIPPFHSRRHRQMLTARPRLFEEKH
jgi:hypothetical protein